MQAAAEFDFAIPFDIPIIPCSSFLGRDNVFVIMRTYFEKHENEGLTRRTFALCGLGGSGKTQMALHYIIQNLSKYKTGVAFLNATSVASLAADFDRLHDILKLGESKNKINAVRSWLSRPENSEWLLVFDNADNLDMTRCNYCLNDLAFDTLPKVRWKKPEALQNSLDRSPLLWYKQEHLNDLLRFSSRLGDTDKAILTAWEIDFKHLEQESPDAVLLLLLFSFLEPSSIPEMVLHRGSTPQKRWGRNGEVTEVSAEDEGVDDRLTKVIQGDMEFDAAVENLLSLSLISCNKESNGLRSFSIHPLVQYCSTQRLSPSEVDKWRWQALLLICHAFPRNRYIEPLNGEIGRIILPHLSRVLSEYDAMCIDHGDPSSFRHELASTLLAASRFSSAQWKVEAISRTKKLLEDDHDPFLNALLAYRESSIMRMSGMAEQSETSLQEFLRDTTLPDREDSELTPRFNAQRGDLIISFSENLIRKGRLLDAKAELMEWRPLGIPHSTLENITLRARDITLGKVLRYQGLFKEALVLLERVLQESFLDDYFEGTGWYRVLLSGVADLYCELGHPVDAEKLLLPELAPMREKGTQDISTGRRLQMSLAETYLQRNMYDEAESILEDLRRAFSSSSGPDHTAQINNFHIWVSLARASHKQSHWEEALSRWTCALSTLEKIKMDRGFNAGLVRCSIAHVLLMTGHQVQGNEILQEAKMNMASESRVFWLCSFNSHWHDFIVESLAKVYMD
ncbi:hypothetical protein TCE0_013r01096 [Talaromyces pinophilus]|uniref:DUF7779 domain-containing protein n=1 Tax=Talaromyces pinophilus TaxID=128442 RepID=A0A698XNH2_TALPI|nr:hypothetical protein TCE0_013r01096 [Talaromyces pinophilus]